MKAHIERWRTAALAPFGIPPFLALWFATFASNMGGAIQSVGAAWLMTSLTRAPDMVALVQTAGSLPFVLLALISGALADIVDRRIVMIAAQTLMVAVSAILTLASFAGWITPWLLLMCTFLMGTGMVLLAPAWSASVVDVVPREQLPAAAALNSLGLNVARSTGPALGGVAVAAGGAMLAFLVNGFSCLAGVVLLVQWRKPVQAADLPPEPIGSAVISGLRYVALSRPILIVVTRAFLFTMCAAALQALLPVVARDAGGGPIMFGVFLGAFGVGAIGGALASARLRTVLGAERMASLGAIAFALAMLVLGASRIGVLGAIAVLLSGASWVATLQTFNITVQMSSPRWVLARALSCSQMATMAGFAAGAAVWGLVAREAGVSAALISAALTMLIALLFTRGIPLPNAPDSELSPWVQAPRAQPLAEPEPHSGPIVTCIEYRVTRDKASQFAAVAHELGRMRRRDGARSWSLAQDISDRCLWVESFRSPTWLDNLRRQRRPTIADEAIGARLFSLISEAPKVRWLLERPRGAAPIDEPAQAAVPPATPM